MKSNAKPVTKGRHLTYGNRCTIETLLNENKSMRYIADCLNFSPSTISREIKSHGTVTKSHVNDCIHRFECDMRHACGNKTCKNKCMNCLRCKNYCSEYQQDSCKRARTLCNGCNKINFCHYQKIVYDAKKAQKEYRNMLVDRRSGFDLTGEEIETINSQVSPLIKQGLSPYHIKQSFGDALIISESTLRRMIRNNELDARALDLREVVKRKPRQKRQMHNELQSPSKAGHLYEDYLNYIQENDCNVVEMDCVEGTKDNHCAILTLHLVSLHLQLYYIMENHTAECVVETLNKIEEALGTELFKEIFELILTDNGHEFWDIQGMEKSISKGKRTKIFFCEPNRSDQKGACENNHKLFRYIVPKSTSIDEFQQSHMMLITNHVNSYKRKSLLGNSPYELAKASLPEDFFNLLGLEIIPSDEIILNPELLK